MPKTPLSVDVTKLIETIPPILEKLPAVMEKLPSLTNNKATLFAKDGQEGHKNGCGPNQIVNVNVNVTEPEDCLSGVLKSLMGIFKKGV